MIKAINNNRYFKFFQPKLFYINQDIDNDDPVRLLSAILEEMDFSNLLQVFPNKTKVHPVNMFAVIIYAYSQGKYSTRDIEFLCKDSQRTKFLLNSPNTPTYSTISRFLSKANNIIYELFCQFVEKLLKLSEITTETIYIDGTKIEAYANKYSFVWKKSTLKYKERLEENILQLIDEFNKYFNKELDSIFDILSFLEELKIHKVYGRGKRKSKEQLFLEKAQSYAERLNKYTNYLEILGERNSFSKTDKEATFMRMKEDYMRNGQLKPGYNLQIGVISEYIVSYDIFHNPSDTKTLIPFLEKIKSQNIEVKNVVADAGYESLSNYEYLKINNYVSYIKPIYYEKSKTRKYQKNLNRVENLEYDEKDFIHSGERVTVNEKIYIKSKDGKEKDVNTFTNVFTIQGGNLMHRKTESTSHTEEGTYTYDDKKNPVLTNLMKVLNPSYFITAKGSRNNILTNEVTSKVNNSEEAKRKYIYEYTYNDKGYPTTQKKYEDKGSSKEHIGTEEYTY